MESRQWNQHYVYYNYKYQLHSSSGKCILGMFWGYDFGVSFFWMLQTLIIRANQNRQKLYIASFPFNLKKGVDIVLDNLHGHVWDYIPKITINL